MTDKTHVPRSSESLSLDMSQEEIQKTRNRIDRLFAQASEMDSKVMSSDAVRNREVPLAIVPMWRALLEEVRYSADASRANSKSADRLSRAMIFLALVQVVLALISIFMSQK